MARIMFKSLRKLIHYAKLSPAARREYRIDAKGLPQTDPGIDRAIEMGLAWQCLAQDCSSSKDGGVAGWYSLLHGWSNSYPETTGYLVPTMLEVARLRNDPQVRPRVARMLDWLVSIQRADGSFLGGLVGSPSPAPVAFDTGQILLGLTTGVAEFGMKYLDPLRRIADWLVAVQDADGCWRRFPPPHTTEGDRVFDTHIARGLLEAARLTSNDTYAQTAIKNVYWAVGLQRDNGWFPHCCLVDSRRPVTHTIAYSLRGILAAYDYTSDQRLLTHALKTGEGLLSAIGEGGYLPGSLDADWHGAVEWSCLAGTAQVAECLLILYLCTGKTAFRDAAYAGNAYVRRTLKLDGSKELRGAVKGSFPIQGDYCAYLYPNWACKFMLDANLLERRVRAQEVSICFS